MMKAKVTSSFRIREDHSTRKYTPGDVAEGESAAYAVNNGYGQALPEEKAAPAPKNKAKKAAPKNKAKKAPASKSRKARSSRK